MTPVPKLVVHLKQVNLLHYMGRSPSRRAVFGVRYRARINLLDQPEMANKGFLIQNKRGMCYDAGGFWPVTRQKVYKGRSICVTDMGGYGWQQFCCVL